jgi:integrase/recombinase XerD
MTKLAPVLESFFTDYLMTQRQASAHTIASYRDTFKLLLGYVHEQAGKLPAQLLFADLDAAVISGFLQHLESSRGNGITTRNARLTAVHSLFRYAALRVPEHAALITRVLAVPAKRAPRTQVCFLTREELEALLAAPDRGTWHGRRDHALILLAAQTGLRVSELTRLTAADVHLGAGPHVRCTGKGRKQRCTPLTAQTAGHLARWLGERRAGGDDPVFCTRAGSPLSADAVARLITKHAEAAARNCPSLSAKTVTPHTLRHSWAQRHADAGVAPDVLRDLMNHRNINATLRYYRIGEDRRREAVDKVAAMQFDRHGNRIWRDVQALLDAEHARYAIGEVAVPYGRCAEPSNVAAGGGACPVRFRCAGCDHFRTDVSYLPDLTAYLDDLLRTRERLAAAIDGVDGWARADATPAREEITRIRRLISRISGDIAQLPDAERAEVDQAIAAIRKHRAASLGMPAVRAAAPPAGKALG